VTTNEFLIGYPVVPAMALYALNPVAADAIKAKQRTTEIIVVTFFLSLRLKITIMTISHIVSKRAASNNMMFADESFVLGFVLSAAALTVRAPFVSNEADGAAFELISPVPV